MYLKNLELSGFKSFRKKETLGFNAPIVAIVGPNGSGKSNIAEAFQFVLGEQSIKSLRGKKGEDLETVERSIRDACTLGFDVDLFFLIGSPGETLDEVNASFALATPSTVSCDKVKPNRCASSAIAANPSLPLFNNGIKLTPDRPNNFKAFVDFSAPLGNS